MGRIKGVTKHPLLLRLTKGLRILTHLSNQVDDEIKETGVSRTMIVENALYGTGKYTKPTQKDLDDYDKEHNK